MKQLKVDAINNGTVIDHIPAGNALKVFDILNPKIKYIATIGMNLSSKALGKKDLIKIEGIELSANEVNRIALAAPDATLTIIRDYEVHKKDMVQIPEKISDAVECPNIKCITNYENIETTFYREKDFGSPTLRCKYCERLFSLNEFEI